MNVRDNEEFNVLDERKPEPEFVKFEDRPEWSDVTPIYMTEAETRLVNIAYSDQFKETYAYLRACLKANERSERAFQLTSECIRLNPANYTVWYYRRVLLEYLGKDIINELGYLDKITDDNPKNYQVWQHRKCLIERLGKSVNELLFTKLMIQEDSKNYHAWQHRQWVISKFKLYSWELDFVNQLLEEDVRNNSAWNHRYFVLERTNRLEILKDSEIDFCLRKIRLAPDNESAWSYLRGIMKNDSLSSNERVNEMVDELMANDHKSHHLIGFKIDCLREQYRKTLEPEIKTRAIDLCSQLMDRYDVVRKEYWKYISSHISADTSF